MEKEQYDQYEYARRRLKQKKHLYMHFVVFILVSLFAFSANHFLEVGAPYLWSVWLISIWLFFFILHFIKVFITDRFMNKSWEREQIEKLVAKQQQKLKELQQNIDRTQTNT